MTLLSAHNLTKRYLDRRSVTAVDDASFDIALGEIVTIWGPRRSGRSTLLRLVAGIEEPDAGTVVFDGDDLRRRPAFGRGIAYCDVATSVQQGRTVAEQLEVSALHSTRRRDARRRAAEALERVDGVSFADADVRELHPHEQVRVEIARALLTKPKLVVLDDPALEVGPLERNNIHALVRSLASDDRLAVLVTVTETMPAVTRQLTIHDGRLRGNVLPSPAEVLAIGRRPET